MSTHESVHPSSKRPILSTHRHGPNKAARSLLIYMRVNKASQEVRIYFNKETVPRYLYGQMRAVHAQPFKMQQPHQENNGPPAIYVVHPWHGLEVLINPTDKTFFIKTEMQEYAATRDVNMKLVLK